MWLLWLSALVMALGVLFGAWQSYRLWGSEERATILSVRVSHGVGRGDLERSRAHVRALPVVVTLACLLIVELFVLSSLQDEDELFVAGPVAIVSILLNIVLLALWLAIFWLNRPRFIVPPHMRADGGFVDVRRARRRDGATLLEGPERLDSESGPKSWHWQDGASGSDERLR